MGMQEQSAPDWATIQAGLAAPFTPGEISWKPVGKGGANQRVSLAAYIDARAVAERLDSVVGCAGWAFTFTPIVVENNEVKIGKGSLSIHGIVKEDVGSWSNWEPSKGAVSDSLKRAGVLWGIGRYLYDLSNATCTLDAHGKIPEATLAQLRERMAARYNGYHGTGAAS